MNKYFRICKKVSEYSTHHQHHIGAVFVKGGRILSTGFNKLKTCPKSPHFYRYCHAEYVAIKFLSNEVLEGGTIYVYREASYGIANAKPCPSCYNLIKSKGIKKIVYTHESGIKEEYV